MVNSDENSDEKKQQVSRPALHFWISYGKQISGLLAFFALVASLITFFVTPQVPSEARLFLFGIFVVGFSALLLQLVVEFLYAFIQEQIRYLIQEQFPDLIQEQIPDESESTKRRAYLFAARRYGLTYRKLTVQAIFQDDGSMRTIRENILEAHQSGIDKIDHFLWALEVPEDESTTVDLIELEAKTPGFNLDSEIVEQASDQLSLIIHIQPDLRSEDRLEYMFIGKTPPETMAMNPEVLKARDMQYDFLAWDITRPTKHLTLRVFIPDTLRLDGLDYNVWYGISRLSHERERERIREFWAHERSADYTELRLDVPYPILGLTYVITWIPQGSEEEIDLSESGQ